MIGKSVRIEQAYKRLPKGGGFVIGTTKSSNKRDVPVSAAVNRMLASRAASGGEHLFTNTVGNRITHSNFYHAVWAPILDRANLGRRPRIHDIRHSHASFLLNNGVPTMVVSKRLGHASIKVTVDRYGHILPESQDAVRALLDTADASSPIQLREAR